MGWPDLLPPKETARRKPAPAKDSQTSTPKHKTPPGTITRYEIRDASGTLIAIHVRKDLPDGKKVWWELPDGTRKLDRPSTALPLYGIDRLPADAKEIVLVEGEKATEALLQNGIAALGTVTGASGVPCDAALRPLLSAFKVRLWPDNDPPGRKHMDKVGAALLRLGHEDVRLIDWKAAPDSGDAADLFSLEGAADEFQALMDEAQPIEWIWEGRDAEEADASLAAAADPGKGLEIFRGTELWTSRFFAHLHKDKMRYCERLGGWYYYDGKRWARAMEGQVERLAKDIPRAMYAMAAAETKESRRTSIVALAYKTEKAGKLKAMLDLAKSEEGIAVSPEVFDAQPWLFNVANGTLNLITAELLPHRAEDMLTNISPAEWRGLDAKGVLFEKFLSEAMAGDQEKIDFLQRAAGYTLSGDMREQIFLFLHGPEAAGKGTFVRAMADGMGTYAQSAEIYTFLMSRRDTVRNDIASLVGARLVTASEPEDGQSFDEGLIKILTGQDKTKARFLFKEHFEFSATFKMWLQGNHRPHIRSTGGAMWRRLLIIPFTKTVPEDKRDKTLGDLLRTPEERSGILAWLVRGCLEWQRGGLRPPDSVRAAISEYRAAEDRLAPFLEECTAESKAGQVPAGELYAKYKAWAEAAGERPLSKRSFGLRLEEKGYFPAKTTGGRRVWNGILLVDREAE
jgi:putative DNA primase/helicase